MGQTVRFLRPVEDDSVAAQSSEQVKSLRDQAYERLLDMMLAGELGAGDILQERRLAEALAISRTPVREALSRLESDGLVTRLRGRLLTVRQFTAAEFMDALNVRKLLELEAASLAAGRVSADRARGLRRRSRICGP